LKIQKKLRDLALATKGFMPPEEGDALFVAACEACRAAPGLKLVEIGSYCGRSTIWLGAAARINNTVLFSVDHHFGSEENQIGWQWHDDSLVDAQTQKLNTLPEFLRTLRQSALGDAVVPVVSDSELFGAQFTTDLSFLFVDGGHGESPTKRDYETWTPKIVPRGYLAIHDVFADPKDGGQAPHDFIYRRALDSGLFTQVSATGSLRVLRRRDEVQPSRVSS